MSPVHLDPSTICLNSAGFVHLVAALPTPTIKSAFERMRAAMTAQTFAEFVGPTVLEPTERTIILPPHIETSFLVENWEGCDYLSARLGEGARIVNVITVIDTDFLSDQLESSESISAYGWGKSEQDTRSVADIVVGQIESATHLLLTGRLDATDRLHRLLGVLNPLASRCRLEDLSPDGLHDFMVSPRASTPESSSNPSARVVPPWLDLLHSDGETQYSNEQFLYRKSLPFDRTRLAQWLSHPPRGLVRGKGTLWLAGEHTRGFGYSCAGSVHRTFAGGPWWAGRHDGVWPTCEEQRRRLLERWHMQFGDRRQEIAFLGLDLDPSELTETLDACLVSEDAALDSLSEITSSSHVSQHSAGRVELH